MRAPYDLRTLALVTPLLLGGFAGCADLLGLEEWQDPKFTATGGPAGSGGAGGSLGTGGSADVPVDPTCADGTKNGGETDVDCGGDACPPCDIGEACAWDADCIEGVCASGLCAHGSPGCSPAEDPDGGNASCNDCVKNGDETDIDCGGDACLPCGLGLACLLDGDCSSGACVEGICGPQGVPGCSPVEDPDGGNVTCNDCVMNGDETGVDCGGDTCLPCHVGQGCLAGADCMSGVCAGGLCQAGDDGTPCVGDVDCEGADCVPGGCWTGFCCH